LIKQFETTPLTANRSFDHSEPFDEGADSITFSDESATLRWVSNAHITDMSPSLIRNTACGGGLHDEFDLSGIKRGDQIIICFQEYNSEADLPVVCQFELASAGLLGLLKAAESESVFAPFQDSRDEPWLRPYGHDFYNWWVEILY
jgi:hypothetical protein